MLDLKQKLKILDKLDLSSLQKVIAAEYIIIITATKNLGPTVFHSEWYCMYILKD